jgi:hypothetical protein
MGKAGLGWKKREGQVQSYTFCTALGFTKITSIELKMLLSKEN